MEFGLTAHIVESGHGGACSPRTGEMDGRGESKVPSQLGWPM